MFIFVRHKCLKVAADETMPSRTVLRHNNKKVLNIHYIAYYVGFSYFNLPYCQRTI